MKRALVALLALFGCGAPAAKSPDAGAFDYYILALSWSPTYCAGRMQDRRDQRQCATRRGFIVHGLWPQSNAGPLENCPSALPQYVARDVVRAQLDVTPSVGLIAHEWRTHGVCTGRSQQEYFAAERGMWEKVRTPAGYDGSSTVAVMTTSEGLRNAFVLANPGMSRQSLTLKCDGGNLEEVRLCFTKDGAFRRCAHARDQCPANFAVPASGGQ